MCTLYRDSCTAVDMPRLIVDVLSMTAELADCWFHHKKATPPEPYRQSSLTLTMLLNRL